jgi:hypothetical protein
MRHHIKELYFRCLPIFFIPSSSLGIANGLVIGLEGVERKKDRFASFCDTIGYTSIGMITGITYPVSFPLLAGYILLQKRK